MIQRVQTLTLLLLILLIIGFQFTPIWSKNTELGDLYILQSYYLRQLTPSGELVNTVYIPYILLLACSVIIIFLALIEIFLYKNRVMQLFIGRIINIILVFMICFSSYLSVKLSNFIGSFEFKDFSFGILILFMGIFANNRSSYYIRQDEKLVKSANRIR